MAVASANEADECAGEGKGEDQRPPHLAPPSSAAQPVKSLPRPAYDGDKMALINLCTSDGCDAGRMFRANATGVLLRHTTKQLADVDEARALIAQGINIDEQDGEDRTCAMSGGDSFSANMIAQHPGGYTALMWAASHNSRMGGWENERNCTPFCIVLEIAQELIRAGAALDLQANNGRTALVIATRNNMGEIAQELIRAGAALDVQDKHGRTALMCVRENYPRSRRS